MFNRSNFSIKSDYKRIAENFISLSLLNGIYMISPLILIPYLIRTLGTESYGIYIFIWTFIYYYIFIVNYGFDFTATKEIAIHNSDKNKISKIYSTTFYTRLILVIFSFIILLLCILLIPKFNQESAIILLGLGVIIGQAFFPTWLFQGMQQMKFITIVNIITRLLPLVLIFIFVKKHSSIGLILLFQSIGYLTGGIFSHFFAIKHYNLELSIPTFEEIKKCLISGWHMFLSTVGISFYRETNTIILGFVTNNYTLVGYYALADKVLRAFQVILNSFSQAIFPHFGDKLNNDRENNLRKYHLIGRYYAVFLLSCVIISIILVPFGIDWYLGDYYPNVIRDIRILLPVILFGGLNYYYGVVGLVNLNYQKKFTVFVLIAGFVNIVLCVLLSKFFADSGAAFSLLTAEVILFLLIVYYFKKNKY